MVQGLRYGDSGFGAATLAVDSLTPTGSQIDHAQVTERDAFHCEHGDRHPPSTGSTRTGRRDKQDPAAPAWTRRYRPSP